MFEDQERQWQDQGHPASARTSRPGAAGRGWHARGCARGKQAARLGEQRRPVDLFPCLQARVLRPALALPCPRIRQTPSMRVLPVQEVAAQGGQHAQEQRTEAAPAVRGSARPTAAAEGAGAGAAGGHSGLARSAGGGVVLDALPQARHTAGLNATRAYAAGKVLQATPPH